MRARFRIHRRKKYAGIKGLRDGFTGTRFRDWLDFQTAPIELEFDDLEEFQKTLQGMHTEASKDVLKRIFTPMVEMWNRIRRMGGAKNTARGWKNPRLVVATKHG
jgi:hypothetical protein